MNTITVLAEMYAGILLIVGFSLLNKKYTAAVFKEIGKSEALVWISGFVTFLIGLISLALYNVWGSDWHVLITIAGWLALLKGIVLTLYPKTAMSWYKKMLGNILPATGVIALVLGAIFLYCALVVG